MRPICLPMMPLSLCHGARLSNHLRHAATRRDSPLNVLTCLFGLRLVCVCGVHPCRASSTRPFLSPLSFVLLAISACVIKNTIGPSHSQPRHSFLPSLLPQRAQGRVEDAELPATEFFQQTVLRSSSSSSPPLPASHG